MAPYKLLYRPAAFATLGTWYYPTDDATPARKAENERLQRELGLGVEATTLTADDVAAMQEVNAARWAVYIEQGVPLRDIEALRWCAQTALHDLKRAVKTPDLTHLLRAKVTRAAGGVLPPSARGLIDELRPELEKIKTLRIQRAERKPRPRSQLPRESRFLTLVSHAVKVSAIEADFRYPRKKRRSPIDIVVKVAPSKVGTNPVIALSEYYAERGRKRDRLTVVVSTDWYRKVHKAGLANIFGPRTLVLHADVTADGTQVVLATQGNGKYEIDVKVGWMSLDKDGNRILKNNWRSA